MRARIKQPHFELDFDGAPAVWNALLRPIFGGPDAPPDPPPLPEPAPASSMVRPPAGTMATPQFAAAVAAAAVPAWTATPLPVDPVPAPSPIRTWFPPRDPREARAPRDDRGAREARREPDGPPRPPWRRRGGPEPEIRIEPTNDPRTLYDRLAALDSRRGEKDAVLVAVWFVGNDEREVHEKEVEKHLAEFGGPANAKIRPHFLKHITRTKCLEPGAETGLVRLSRKGREQIRLLCGV